MTKYLFLSIACLFLLVAPAYAQTAKTQQEQPDVLALAYQDSSSILFEISQFVEAEILIDECKEKGISNTISTILLRKKDAKLETLINEKLDQQRTALKDKDLFADYETALFLTVPAQERGFFIGYIEGMDSDAESEDLCDEGMFLSDMVLRSE